jgi:GNAT superfamily N-acetyltransferase
MGRWTQEQLRARATNAAALRIRPLTTVAEIRAARRLRREHWARLDPERQAARERAGFFDDVEVAHPIHLGAFLRRELVAAGRLSIHERPESLAEHRFFERALPGLCGPVAAINRLAIRPEAQGRGVDRRLDEARIELALRLRCRSALVVWYEAQGAERRRGLEALGFRPIEDLLGARDDLFPPLVPMILALTV